MEKKQAAESNDEIDLGRLFGLLMDHKWLIVAITGFFTLLGLLNAMLTTPVYQADSLIEIEARRNSGNPVQDIGGLFGGGQPQSTSEIQILQSRYVLGQAANQANLPLTVTPNKLPIIGDFIIRHNIKRPDFAQGWSSVWAGESVNLTRFVIPGEWIGNAFTLKSTGSDSYELLRNDKTILTGRVGELAQSRDGNVEVRVMDLNASKGAEFTVVKHSDLSVINSLRSRFTVTEEGRSGTGILNLTLTSTNPQKAEDSLREITQVYLTQNIERQSAEAEKSLEFLRQQAPEVRQKLAEAENKLNNYRVNQDSVDLTQETQSVLSRLVDIDSQLNQLKFDEADLSRRFTKNHPAYQALLEKEQQLRNDKKQLQKRVDNLPETQQEVLRLQRDVNVTQGIYVQLLNKMQEMNIAKAGAIGNVRIIDKAIVQPSPIKPRKTLIVLLAFIIGLVVSIVTVLIRGMMNKGIESPDQLEDMGMPVYASIPLSTEQSRLVKRVRTRQKRGGTSVDIGILAARDPADMSVEAVRGLRTSLHFAMLEAPNARIMITGPSPGIGKSFVTANLAAVCAQAQQKVLVIDGDMRKGHLHHAFQGPSDGGLSDLLSQKMTVEQVVRSGGIEGLDYISRGMAPPNPAELLMSERFTRLLEWADQHYDLVIIDTPPVLAVTDASIVGKQVGTTMLIARFGQNPPKEIEQAWRRLEQNGIEVRGCILNAVERTASMRYGGGYDNYQYSYR
ncbi:polysaccharide biosynthesis tyrosine autokinase [Phytohalomonas tamaricis]|uniref:polysaccharide biosynthesis tyrosine autokinase n=1 Tax=Phytohalomonas tamaricis TaxID=2081032 RepID=UPI000D0B5343|nr:polysaccharide biosynthesis tyrosine autokinase [Phytohalomonas tamaricis]